MVIETSSLIVTLSPLAISHDNSLIGPVIIGSWRLLSVRLEALTLPVTMCSVELEPASITPPLTLTESNRISPVTLGRFPGCHSALVKVALS